MTISTGREPSLEEFKMLCNTMCKCLNDKAKAEAYRKQGKMKTEIRQILLWTGIRDYWIKEEMR